jgi:hypothetical protein
MQQHSLNLEVRDGKVIVSCACGAWRRERPLRDVESPSEVMRRLEEEHARHVAESSGAP